jgi:hypothetical protein
MERRNTLRSSINGHANKIIITNGRNKSPFFAEIDKIQGVGNTL